MEYLWWERLDLESKYADLSHKLMKEMVWFSHLIAFVRQLCKDHGLAKMLEWPQNWTNETKITVKKNSSAFALLENSKEEMYHFVKYDRKPLME